MVSKEKLMIKLTQEETNKLFNAQHIWQQIATEVDKEGYMSSEYEEMFDSMDEIFSRLCDLLDNGFEECN